MTACYTNRFGWNRTRFRMAVGNQSQKHTLALSKARNACLTQHLKRTRILHMATSGGFPIALVATFTCVYFLIFLSSIVGNSFVLWLCYKLKRQRESSLTCYIANLAIADVAFTVLTIFDLMWTWVGGEISCKLQSFAIEACYSTFIIDSCSYQLWASEGCGRPFKSQTHHKGKHATKVNRRSVSWRSRRFAFALCLSNPNRWHRNRFLHEYHVRGYSATDLLYYSRILLFPCTSCLHDSCSEESFSILTLKRCIKYIKHHSFHAL